ncbi:PAS domain S-box protein [Defluviimonas sp. D31]|uniref:PAS domain S-box protein n=1 Tax=Defluviimonas sp. D31 TaxID=3083253 RepID=UPI00296E443A|nr:PAS domain S-box protein [Defluviimonas sp. D31]MDW4550020.1 PAS domain S-box protein [Defluviimonas sp. D31]
MAESDRSAYLLDSLLDAAVDAIVVADTDGRMVRVNPAACRLFGYSSGEMVGESIDMLVPDADTLRHADVIERYLRTGEARIIGKGREVEGLRRDGSIFPLHLSVGQSRIDGRVLFVALLHDISRRKSAEAALVTAQRMEALGLLTGGVAHDFNNLLTVIVGNLELLEGQLEGNRGKEMIREALAAAEIGSSLIQRLRALGRRGHLKPVRLDVNETVRATVAILRRTLVPNVRLDCALAADLWAVQADPAELQAALVNLVVNANDAMPDGGDIVIRTSMVAIDDDYVAHEVGLTPGEFVRVSVTDNGTGMPPEILKRAFEPYFSTKAETKGTGLGLAMVYGFANQSGGRATIYSEAGLGTTVSLYFPADRDPARSEAEPAPRPKPVVEPGAGETVLVVEDNENIRRLSVARLQAMGYRAIAAADSEEALEILGGNPAIDALFTDIVMPGPMNGTDLALRVRAEWPHVAILLTSGFSGDLIQPQKELAPPFPVLKKPYHQAELATRLRVLLSGRASVSGL